MFIEATVDLTQASTVRERVWEREGLEEIERKTERESQ